MKSPDLRTGSLSPRPGPAEPISPFAPTAEINILRPGETPARGSSVFSAAPDRWPVVDGYEILGELGRGGMGVVYKSRQLGLNRIVALKMLLGGPFADPESHARFAVEAEAVARLQHPNIVQIFATGTQASPLGNSYACPFFAQEYVDGGNLSARLTGTPHRPRDAARLVATLARAVHYAHEHGIIHRDLKPANVLLQKAEAKDQKPEKGQGPLSSFVPKIADFGLAKQLDNSGRSLTVTGIVAGTPEYMAPEQALGAAPVGPAADVYALGVILYEMTTGRRPFEGATSLETLELAQSHEPVPPSRLTPRFPRDLQTICLTCLRKEPNKRYASALALAEDLDRFLKGEPIQARPVGRIERSWRWARRRPAVAALAAAVVLTAFGGVCGITAAWLHALAGWGEADTQRLRALEERTTAERRRDEAEGNLYFSRIAQAQLERRLNNFASAERLLDLCRPADETIADRRGWEWHHLKGVLHADLLTIPNAHEGLVSALAFSPDGEQLATVGGSPFRGRPPDRMRIWQVWGSAAGECVREVRHSRRINNVVWAKDGRRIAWAGMDGAVRAIDAETGAFTTTRTIPDGMHPPVLSADGRRYASFDRAGQLYAWDVQTEDPILNVHTAGPQLRHLGFNPDGLSLAISGQDALTLWDIATAREVRAFPQSDDGRSKPAFSPDGRLVALGTGGGRARVWDVTTGQLVQTFAGHTGFVLGVAFSPDGQTLATAGADHTVRVWTIRTGVEELLLRGHQGRASCVCFHPSGRYLASGGEQPSEIKVWDLTRHQEYITASRVPGRIEAVGFSADSEAVHVARATGWLQTCRAEVGVERGQQELDVTGQWRTPAILVAFSGDGRRLAAVSRENTRIVAVTDVASGKVIHRLENPYEVLHVNFSQDGRRVAASATEWRGGGRHEVRVWDAETGERLAAIDCERFTPTGTYSAVALSPDGRLLAYDDYPNSDGSANPGARTTRVYVHDLETGATWRTVTGLDTHVRRFAFSPDGRYLAISCDDPGVVVYDCQADRWLHEQPLTGSSGDNCHDLAFTADGQRLAAVTRVQVLIWDVPTGQTVLALRGAPPRPSDNGFNPRIAWSPDGRRLAASNWNSTVSIWDSADRATPAAKRALHQAAEERAAAPATRD